MNRLLLFFIMTLFLSCDKDDDKNETLPPATQTGARTFGCLVDGKAFVHNDGVINCFYQFVNGGYYFGIQGINTTEDPVAVYLNTYAKEIMEGTTYIISLNEINNVWGGAFFRLSATEGIESDTNSQYTGELTITKLDFETNIVSGTFWFDVAHPVTGETVEFTEGRFDTYFTQ